MSGLKVLTMTLVLKKDSGYGHGLMLEAWIHHTQGKGNTNGMHLNSRYRIDTLDLHTYERAKCCPNARFFLSYVYTS